MLEKNTYLFFAGKSQHIAIPVLLKLIFRGIHSNFQAFSFISWIKFMKTFAQDYEETCTCEAASPSCRPLHS